MVPEGRQSGMMRIQGETGRPHRATKVPSCREAVAVVQQKLPLT